MQFFDNDTKIIASNLPKNNLQVWDALTKRQLAKIETPEELKSDEKFWAVLPDAKLLSYRQGRGKVKGVEDGTRLGVDVAYPQSAIHLWSVNTGKLLETIQSTPPNQIRSFQISPDQEFLLTHEYASGTFFETQPDFVRMFELASKKWREIPREIEFPVLISSDSRQAFAFIKSGKQHIAAGIGVYRFPDFKLIRQIDLPPGLIGGSQLLLSDDERYLIAQFNIYQQENDWNHWQSAISGYEIETGKTVGNFQLSTPEAVPTLVSRQLADGTLVYWNLNGKTKKLVGLDVPGLNKKWETELGDYELVRSASVEPGGKWIAAICYPDDSQFGLRNHETDWELVPQSEMLIVDETGSVLEKVILPVGASTIAFRKDGKSAAITGVGSVYLMDFTAPFAKNPKSK